jgi:hypothetical protein
VWFFFASFFLLHLVAFEHHFSIVFLFSSIIFSFLYFFQMNIFVAKLNFGTSSEDLREAFEAFGEVDSAKVIMDHDTGKSRGFGFVEMPNDDEAQAAIDALNETDFDGNTIVCKKAEPREGGGGGRGGFGGGGNRGGGGYGGGGGGNRGGGGYGGGGGGNRGGGGYGGGGGGYGGGGGGGNRGGGGYGGGGNRGGYGGGGRDGGGYRDKRDSYGSRDGGGTYGGGGLRDKRDDFGTNDRYKDDDDRY